MFPSDYEHFIYKSRYARWIDELGRRENLNETVDRYLNFMQEHLSQKHGYLIPASLEAEARDFLLSMDALPSMRAFMTAGAALDRSPMAGFNCSYLSALDPLCFSETMNLLLHGTGVGYSVERQFTEQMPPVADEMVISEAIIQVEDSKEGWYKAFATLIKRLYRGEVCNWDTSLVRKKGERLKTFGGRASGPEPLIELFQFTVETFKHAVGRRLEPIEVHDILCKVADIVVVGGVRRSAMISLSDVDDPFLAEAKSPVRVLERDGDRVRVQYTKHHTRWFNVKLSNWDISELERTGTIGFWTIFPHRALANNSAVYESKPSSEVFLREWTTMVESHAGERGFFNREAADRQIAKLGDRRQGGYKWGTNPCCFSGKARLLTDTGYVSFAELAQRDSVNIVSHDGSVSVGKVWSTGVKPVVDIKFHPKLELDPITCTADHVFQLSDGSECEAGKLRTKNLMPYVQMREVDLTLVDFLMGFVLGDGTLTDLNNPTKKGVAVSFSKKDQEIAEAWGHTDGTNSWYSQDVANWCVDYDLPPVVLGQRGLPQSVRSADALSGLYSANGSVVSKHRVSLKSTDKEQVNELQAVLTEMGIVSYITINKERNQIFSNGEYLMAESYDLNISRYTSLVKFAELINFGQIYKREALRELINFRSPMVTAVVPVGEDEVFDFTEPKNHWGVVDGFVAHNCEIILRDCGVCNLSEVPVYGHDTVETLRKKVRMATVFGTWQSTLVDFVGLRPAWKINAEAERLLGVSLTGSMDHLLLQKAPEALLEELKQVAIETNALLADAIGINRSAAITCVKPSGTTSQLTNTASGLHVRHSPFYIRTVRGDKKDPITQFMIDQGVPNEACAMKPDTTVIFSFPIKAPEGAITREDVTALDQLETWKRFQDFWCEHKPSCTVSVRDEEWVDVGAWVYRNFDALSGISFLPHSDHVYAQAPYQECSEQEYQAMKDRMPVAIEWDRLNEYELEDGTSNAQSLACSGGVCDFVDIVAAE